MQPLISVIIPTYNRSHLIGETLESVLKQTYENWECLVIDDGSTDDTRAIMDIYTKKDSRIIYYPRPKNRLKGANACRNYGFKISKGEYINWFDDDDLMHPEKLEMQLKALQHSNYNFSVCQSEVFEGKKNKSFELRHPHICSASAFEDYLKMKIIWLTQAPLWKRNFLENQSQLFNENLKAAQEWEFHCRILYASPKYHYTNIPLVFLRKHSESITYGQNKYSKSWNYFVARLQIYKNKDLRLDRSSIIFLRKFLLDSFKKMVRDKNPHTFEAFIGFIIPEGKLSIQSKLFALLSILSYKVLGKGNYIQQKIKYS